MERSYHAQLAEREKAEKPLPNHHLAYEYDRAARTNNPRRELSDEQIRMMERGE